MRSGVDKHEFETGIDQAVAAADAGMILKQNHLLDPRLVRTALEIIARLQSSDPDFDDCSDAARLIDLLTVDCENNLFEIERLKRERSHVYYLLARIHRDGGQYTADHGVEKACDDAEAQVVTWLETINSVDSLIEQARIAEREACALVCDELEALLPGTKTGNTLQWAAEKIRARSAS